MKINRIIVTTAINVILLPFTLGLILSGQRHANGVFDCCQESKDGRYCCQNCCWLTHDCDEHGGCSG